MWHFFLQLLLGMRDTNKVNKWEFTLLSGHEVDHVKEIKSACLRCEKGRHVLFPPLQPGMRKTNRRKISNIRRLLFFQMAATLIVWRKQQNLHVWGTKNNTMWLFFLPLPLGMSRTNRKINFASTWQARISRRSRLQQQQFLKATKESSRILMKGVELYGAEALANYH